MKLNYDCIRDIMLYIEQNQQYTTQPNGKQVLEPIRLLSIQSDSKLSKRYSSDDIIYSMVQLLDVGYIVGTRVPKSGTSLRVCTVNNITPAGHEFLGNVKSDTVWKTAKQRAGELGVGTLKLLGELAKDVALHLLTNH